MNGPGANNVGGIGFRARVKEPGPDADRIPRSALPTPAGIRRHSPVPCLNSTAAWRVSESDAEERKIRTVGA